MAPPIYIEKAGGFDRIGEVAIEKAGGFDNMARVYIETGTGKDDYALVFQRGGLYGIGGVRPFSVTDRPGFYRIKPNDLTYELVDTLSIPGYAADQIGYKGGVVVDGTGYIVAGGNLYSLNLATGALARISSVPSPNINGWNISSMFKRGNQVYVSEFLNIEGTSRDRTRVRTFDVKNGTFGASALYTSGAYHIWGATTLANDKVITAEVRRLGSFYEGVWLGEYTAANTVTNRTQLALPSDISIDLQFRALTLGSIVDTVYMEVRNSAFMGVITGSPDSPSVTYENFGLDLGILLSV